jgi:hypothetical protein
MSLTVRRALRGVQGRVRVNHNIGSITSPQAVVNISAGEIKPGPSSRGPGGVEQDFMYNLGDADVWVSNVSPHLNQHFGGEPGGVEFILHVDWDSPLDVAYTVTLDDALPVDIQN